ncbi:MAG: hypothetical protein AAF615_06150, partial [Pseudomonadota bacterium]
VFLFIPVYLWLPGSFSFSVCMSLSVGNSRLVIGKWLYNHTPLYVVIMLITAGLLGIALAVAARSRPIKAAGR